MDRDTYKRWRNHPLRSILKRAEQGQHVYADQLDDLNLPAKQRKATEQAIARAHEAHEAGTKNQYGVTGPADALGPAVLDSLPSHHETREQHEARRAREGDAAAQANIKAREQASDELVDEIWQRRHAHGD